MVMTVSSVRRMSESSKVEGGGTALATAAAGSTNALAEVSPVEEGGGGATLGVSLLQRRSMTFAFYVITLETSLEKLIHIMVYYLGM